MGGILRIKGREKDEEGCVDKEMGGDVNSFVSV
jgi:hypothetical protein